MDTTDEADLAVVRDFSDVTVVAEELDSTWDGDVTLTDLHARIVEQEGQILTDLDEDGLLEESDDSLGGTSAIQRLEKFCLLSDKESAHSQSVENSSPTNVARGSQEGLLREDRPQIVRQVAVEELPSAPPREIVHTGRTKEEKARNGTLKSLAYLTKMSKADPSTLSSRDRHLLRRHRQSVAKFERIYGAVSDVLGWTSPWRELANVAANPENTPKSDGLATTSTSCPVKKGKGDVPVTKALMSSERAAEVKGTPPKPSSKTSKVPEAKKSDKLPTVPSKDFKKGVTGGNSTGRSQPSKPAVSKASNLGKRSGTSSAGTPKGSHKETIKRARSGDDQPSSSSKKVKKSTSLDGCLQVAVIDRNDPDGKISADLWQSVEGRLLDEIAVYCGSSKDVSFLGADWVKGVKIVNCGNKNSLEFLRVTIGKCSDLKPDAKLEVIQASELPLRSIVTVWIPPPVKTVETILAVLAKQNGKLLTHQWRSVASLACKENAGKDFRFAVDRKSLEVLDEMGGVAKFGLGTVRFRYQRHGRTKEATSGADKPAPL